ncbi:MAG: class I SAM-dependent RNA methyltransferase [Acidimicrobiia bacterium]|nr:class I SAM-dependent RNA methyltransferase [Acidimicrobiia bacterium]
MEVQTTAVAAGGAAVARDDDGRVVFVRGALPGERVKVALTGEHKSYATAELRTVVEPAPDRVVPPCPFVDEGYGGCDWQHVAPSAQPSLREAIVRDALVRIGRIVEPQVSIGPALPTEGFRTIARGTVVGDRFAFRRWHSHDPLAVASCLICHPLVAEIIEEGRFPGAREVTIRAGARTGERLVIVGPSAAGARVPDGVTVVGRDELRRGRRAWYHEEVGGRTWRISAGSFFQCRADGADALVDVVRTTAASVAPDAGSAADLCAGVGLFAGTVAPAGDGPVVAVERDRSAVADARHNLSGDRVRVVRSALEAWRPDHVDLVIADPPRTGLDRDGVARVKGSRAGGIVLVSCDPASLGRDARLLTAAGYRHVRTTLVDLFPHTAHVEAVTGFVRG